MLDSTSRGSHPEGTQTTDALATAAAQLRDVPAWKPFPVELMPMPVRDYVTDVADSLRVAPAAVAVPLLAALGGVCGTKVFLNMDPQAAKTWLVRPIFWTVVIANSGSNKSAGWEAADDVAMVVERELQSRNQYEQESYDSRMQEWKDADPAERGFKPEPPPTRQLLVDDTTVEALAAILQDNPNGVLLSTDELRNWFDTFMRYRKAGGSDATRWLPFHSGKRFIVNRKGTDGKKQRLFIPHAAVSVMGTTQPKVFSRVIGDEERDSGFLARLLMCMPPGKPRLWKPSGGGAKGTTRQVVEDLVGRLFRMSEGQVLLSPEATARFVGWQNPWSLESFKLSDAEKAAMRAKLEEVALRVALLYHVCDQVWDGDTQVWPGLGLEHLNAGITTAEWFFNEGLRVYATFKKTSNPMEKLYVETMQWAVEKTAAGNPLEGGFTARDVYRARIGSISEPAQAQLLVDNLLEHKLLVEVKEEEWTGPPNARKRKMGRPTRKFLPAVRQIDKTPNFDASDDE